MKARNNAAMTPPSTGEITQLAAILPMVTQFTADKPTAAMPAPITPPTTACVVDTGAPKKVARLTHSADDSRAAIMSQTKLCVSGTSAGSMIPFEIVFTTSPPASSAPALSNKAAITSAPTSDNARDPTAGPTLLANVVGADIERHITAKHRSNDDENRIGLRADIDA